MATSQPALTPEFAATFRDMMVMSLAQETQTTAKVLAAVPNDKRDYRPDPKARSAYQLAWHIAVSDVLFLESIATLDFSPMMQKEQEIEAKPPATTAEIVSWYQTNIAAALNKIKKLTPQQLTTVLDFAGAFKFPAFVYLTFGLNHDIHHRGQLSAYLRPMGSKVPSIYGGSADEPWQGATAA